MAFDLTNFYTEVRGRIQDQAATNPHLENAADLDIAARAALNRITLDRPADLVAEFAGEDDKWYVLTTVLSGWRDGFSGIKWIEYPMAVVADDDTPNPLDEDDWKIIDVLVGGNRTLQLYFPNHSPVSTETIRVAYTGVHTLDGLDTETATTIPVVYEAAYYSLGAAMALQQMAAKMAQKGDPTLGADLTNHPDLTQRLERNARFWMEQYAHAVGVDLPGMEGSGGAPLASAIVDWDARESTGHDMIFHQRRGR